MQLIKIFMSFVVEENHRMLRQIALSLILYIDITCQLDIVCLQATMNALGLTPDLHACACVLRERE